jgi:hypothetical protein
LKEVLDISFIKEEDRQQLVSPNADVIGCSRGDEQDLIRPFLLRGERT